jgi:hypothetical protein
METAQGESKLSPGTCHCNNFAQETSSSFDRDRDATTFAAKAESEDRQLKTGRNRSLRVSFIVFVIVLVVFNFVDVWIVLFIWLFSKPQMI